MKFPLLLCLVIPYISSISQSYKIINGDTVNRTDKKGRQQGKWIDLVGNSRIEWFYVNNKQEGECRCYDENNQLESISHYKNGEEDGLSVSYKDGKVVKRQFYKNGYPATMAIEYHSNGQPKNGGTFFWDKGNGTKLLYDSTGFLLSKKTYFNFKLNGPFEEYFSNHHLKEKGIYKNNKYWTIEKRYWSNGEPIDSFSIKAGTGHVACYDSSERFIRYEEYKSGLLWNIQKYNITKYDYSNTGDFRNGNGVIKDYDSAGNMVLMKTYKNGLLNGTYKIYNPQFDVLIVGECINDNKEGQWLRYSKGRLANILFYKKDRDAGIACF